MPLTIVVLLVIVLAPLAVALMRANELFAVRVRGEAVRLVRGRVPQRLLDDIADVVRQGPPGRASIRVVVEDRRPTVHATGALSPEQLQRLRNVVSLWPLAKIRSAPRRR